MNTTSSSTLIAAALIALVGATALAFGNAEIKTPQEVVQLERVVLTGKRAADTQLAKIEQLPRVVIEGRRAGADTQVLASATVCKAQTLC